MDGSQGLVPAPSPLGLSGVTYTFQVTRWDVDCVAASLLAPARTHQLQPGQACGPSPCCGFHCMAELAMALSQ